MRDRSAALFALAALGLGPACTSPKPTDDSGPGTVDSGDTDSGDTDSGDTDSGDTDSGDSGVPEVCVTATSTASPEVGTVVTVRWDSEVPGPSVVEYGPDATYGWQTPGGEAEATTHAVVVAGMPAGAEWHWRVRTAVDGVPCVSEDHVEIAVDAPSDLPSVVATGDAGAEWTLLSVNTSGGPWVMLVDGQGRPSWWSHGEPDHSTTEVRLAADGLGLWWNLASTSADGGVQRLRHASLDGLDVQDVEVPDQHHDFLELPDGRLAYIAADIRNAKSAQVAGDAIRVVDPADGAVTTVWSTWDDLPVEINYDEAYGFYPGALDWTHGNGLVYDADADTYYLSAKNKSQVYKVTAGSLVWTLGEDGDFALTDGELFHGQHGPILTDAGIMVFSNGDKNTSPPDSKVMEFSFDEGARTVAEVWRYDFDQTVYVQLLGNGEPRPDGSVFIGMGDTGQTRRVSREGVELSRLTVTGISGMSYTHPVTTLGGALP